MYQRPCNCNRISTGKYYKSSDCRMCWLYHYSPHYAQLWGKQPSEPMPLGPNTLLPTLTNQRMGLPCIHLGPVLERANCNCPLKFVHRCDLHKSCVRGMQYNPDIRSCQNCPDYKPDSPLAE